MADQGTYTATNLPTDGKTIQAADVNTDLQGLIDEFNKTVGSTKLSDSGVTATKLSTGAILLGYAQSTSSFVTTNTASTDVTSLNVSVAVPAGGRMVKITAFAPYMNSSAIAGTEVNLNIYESATRLTFCGFNQPVSVYNVPVCAIAMLTPSVGLHTYKVTTSQASAGTITLSGSATSPMFILVEVI